VKDDVHRCVPGHAWCDMEIRSSYSVNPPDHGGAPRLVLMEALLRNSRTAGIGEDGSGTLLIANAYIMRTGVYAAC
jgi:hypothetical protein